MGWKKRRKDNNREEERTRWIIRTSSVETQGSGDPDTV